MDVKGAIRIARLSDVGQLRERNEDAVASDLTIGLAILADGMGGYKAGEIASEIAVLVISTEVAESMKGKSTAIRPKTKFLPETEMLMDAVDKANASIYQISKEQPKCHGMGTTLVVGLFTENKLITGHIGDSRMYRLRGEMLLQLTVDHSLVQEQIEAGMLTIEQAKESEHKNLVTRALGIDRDVELEIHEHNVQVRDMYLLCSDGLSDMVTDEEIRILLMEAGANVERAATNLVRFANEKGGKDNISVVVAYVKKEFTSKQIWLDKLFNNSKI
jgi:protein phosphatase